MYLALVVLGLLQIFVHIAEISFPHKIQQLLLDLKENSDSFDVDRYLFLYSFLPVIHIPFVILLFTSEVNRFFYYGIFFVASFILEGLFVSQFLKYKELITLAAVVSLIINIDVVRSVLA